MAVSLLIITCSTGARGARSPSPGRGPVTVTTAHMSREKNWAIVRTVVGYHRCDTTAELLLLNEIWVLQSKLTNYFYPQQKLVSKVRNSATVSKKYDTATTPHHRAERHKSLDNKLTKTLVKTHAELNPAAVQRQIQALTTQLLTLVTSKTAAARKPAPTTNYARIRE
ncbi:MAG: hypothetical protein ACREP9_06455 [Candidatus Dormibacteraceae bacterium]